MATAHPGAWGCPGPPGQPLSPFSSSSSGTFPTGDSEVSPQPSISNSRRRRRRSASLPPPAPLYQNACWPARLLFIVGLALAHSICTVSSTVVVAPRLPASCPLRPPTSRAGMWYIDLQILLLCIVMPPAGSYAIKHIYVGPAAADFTDVDLCLNLVLTLLGFIPGITHALYLFARHKGCAAVLAMDASVVWLLLIAEGLLVRMVANMRPPDRNGEAAAQAAGGAAAGAAAQAAAQAPPQ